MAHAHRGVRRGRLPGCGRLVGQPRDHLRLDRLERLLVDHGQSQRCGQHDHQRRSQPHRSRPAIKPAQQRPGQHRHHNSGQCDERTAPQQIAEFAQFHHQRAHRDQHEIAQPQRHRRPQHLSRGNVSDVAQRNFPGAGTILEFVQILAIDDCLKQKAPTAPVRRSGPIVRLSNRVRGGRSSVATAITPTHTGSRPSAAIFFFQTSGASWCTFCPAESTATVTGMSSTVNS